MRAGPGELPVAGFYGQYPPSGARPGLELDLELDPDITLGASQWPGHPAFHQRVTDEGTVELARFDAAGQVTVPEADGDPVVGRFRLAPNAHAVEAAIRACASIALPRRDALILHASAVEAGGRAHVFAGVSGAGKSTLARMLEEGLPDCRRLSDELLVAARGSQGWTLHVAPFIGGEGLPHGAHRPIATLQFLEQAPIHELRPLGAAAATQQLLRHVLAYASHPDTAARLLDLACGLAAEIPCSELAFRKDLGVAAVIGIT